MDDSITPENTTVEETVEAPEAQAPSTDVVDGDKDQPEAPAADDIADVPAETPAEGGPLPEGAEVAPEEDEEEDLSELNRAQLNAMALELGHSEKAVKACKKKADVIILIGSEPSVDEAPEVSKPTVDPNKESWTVKRNFKAAGKLYKTGDSFNDKAHVQTLIEQDLIE